jgi:hypothetical protein
METNDNQEFDPGVEDHEAAAAAEAGAIGGESGDEGRDPEMRPVEQAGGGEAEGFEQAEQALVNNAAHGEGNPLAAADESAPENIEGQRATVEYGEADEVDVTEVTSDPDDPDDPGEGTPVAPDR